MSVVQTTYPNDSRPAKPLIATIIGEAETPDGRQALELQVSIEGQDRTVLLMLHALEDHGLSGPAAVAELRGIRKLLETLSARWDRIRGTAE